MCVHTQGTFGVREELGAVLEFITENLETPLPFHILDSVTGARLDNAAASLQVTIIVEGAKVEPGDTTPLPHSGFCNWSQAG